MNPYLVDRKRGESYIGISIEYRMYPNQAQEKWLVSTGNKLRGAYNLLVATYVKDKEFKDIIRKNKQTQKDVYDLLTTTEWLEGVPTDLIVGVKSHFFTALDNFRKHKKRVPKFKKKSNLLALTSNNSSICKSLKFNWAENTFTMFPRLLAKASISSNFKTILHRKFEGCIVKNISINRKSDGNWYVSFNFDTNGTMELPKPVQSTKKLGIDVGVKDMAITSEADKFQVNLKKIKELEEKINKINKGISRKQRINKGNFMSRNYKDLLHRKGRLQTDINNLRKQTHQYATNIITSGEYGTINVEDLKLAFMLKNKHLAQSVARIGIRSFTTRLESVSKSKGIVFNKVNPKNTSRKCNCCGHINKNLGLKDRFWECEGCGEVHDRDINAAKNIRDLEISK
jgi:putative transposase